MLLGIKSKKIVIGRHIVVGVLSAVLVYLFYLSYQSWGVVPALWPDWGVAHPFWRAWAHAAFVFLFTLLIIGPAARIWPWFARFISWRRELGIWFAVLSAGHGYAIWDRWAMWSVERFFGVEYVETLGSFVMFRPEVGIMNMMAVIIFPMIIVLAITSSDRAVSFLGISSWKWLHSSLVSVIFYVIVLRGILYLFFFFQPTLPELRMYPSIWFLYPFLGMSLIAVSLQAIAFVKTVLEQKGGGKVNFTNNKFQNLMVVGVGIFLVLPILLASASVVYLDSRISVVSSETLAQQNLPQNYASSFHMVIKEEAQDVYLWVQDIDTKPYFRQTINVDGSPVIHQIYRYDEKTLYMAEKDPNGVFAWSKEENVEIQSLGVASVITGPASWALELGVGEHQISTENGELTVSIISVGEEIDNNIFNTPSSI
ncbi:hypothetical protein CL654_02015 [bacterium]|nr:hypothetical protein [bacterium]|tara:strand:+ start:33421 stop:34698 length:1278 start_codon:yes stop_codon:yes gene_type:complete